MSPEISLAYCSPLRDKTSEFHSQLVPFIPNSPVQASALISAHWRQVGTAVVTAVFRFHFISFELVILNDVPDEHNLRFNALPLFFGQFKCRGGVGQIDQFNPSTTAEEQQAEDKQLEPYKV